jgi:septum formation inhibitor-activating ATPase MinD
MMVVREGGGGGGGGGAAAAAVATQHTQFKQTRSVVVEVGSGLKNVECRSPGWRPGRRLLDICKSS